jgi:hypothetical protein
MAFRFQLQRFCECVWAGSDQANDLILQIKCLKYSLFWLVNSNHKCSFHLAV